MNLEDALPERLDLRSMDVKSEQIKSLLKIFPEVGTEGGKIDFDRLRSILGTAVDVGKERYGMNWPGKSECFKTIQATSTGTLRPRVDRSLSFDSAQNVFVEGDNLEVLKLLQKAYLGRIKVIYIDPPYNTGNDFIYPDNFSESLQTYLEYTGQVDTQGRKFGTNTETDGRFHSKWMNMIFPRLNLARNLLRDDGLIFMSIDDVELANLRKIADEVFGEDCFVANFIWEKRTNRENRKVVSSRHDYILCYCKNSIQKSSVIQQLPMSEKALANYKNPDNDPRGPWKSDPATAQAGHGTKSQFYVFTAPNGKEHHLESGRCWLYTKDVFEEEVRQGKIWFGKDGNGVPRVKTYLEAKERGLTPETIWFAADVATNEIAKTQLKELFDGDSVFETPKPAALIKHAIQICSGTDGIVLDFFAGSGVTAEAVLRQNAEDGGDRKFILVQLPERIEHKLYKRISDITIERVKRVVSQTSATSTPANGRGDAGFRVFELDSSNFEGWNADVTHDPKTLQRQLELYVSHLREDRTSEDVLFELLLKSGFDLATPISKDTLAGKTVYSVASGSFLICLDEDINLDLIREIARRKPERIVCLDRGFAGNDQLKANAMQIFKANGVESFKTV